MSKQGWASPSARQLAALVLTDPDGGNMAISSELTTHSDNSMNFTVTNPETGRRFGVHLGLAELEPVTFPFIDTLDRALDVRFDCDLGEDVTVREFLGGLLVTLWDEQHQFDGKRPWGNSGGDFDLYVPLIDGGFIAGKVDDDGCIEDLNEAEAHGFVQKLIARMIARPGGAA